MFLIGDRGYTYPYELAPIGEPGIDGYPGMKGNENIIYSKEFVHILFFYGIKGETGDYGVDGMPGDQGVPGLRGFNGETGPPGQLF